MIEMIPVDSSNIESIGWDEVDEELFITFNSGSTYVYSEVPKEVFDSMMNAESKGKFFHANIKGKYSYDKV